MKFLIDAQLPARFALHLIAAGHDAIHTTQLADGNRTTDEDIARLADEQDRVVVSKDRDFRDSHLLQRSPRRLLLVSTGNIANDDLLELFAAHLGEVVAALSSTAMVELRAGELLIRDD